MRIVIDTENPDILQWLEENDIAFSREDTPGRYDFPALVEIVRVLRAPGGCPWDIEQTHASLRENMVEEAWEVVDAIESGRMDRLYDELGDVLLQVLMHASIGADHGAFTLLDITDAIARKLIHRHPHIFGDTKVSGSAEVLVNWEALKKEEKGLKSQAAVMEDVPAAFPAALRAHKVQKKARQVGFDWNRPEEAFAKVQEELEELKSAMEESIPQEVEHEAGDLLFAAVNAARLCGVNSELALHRATRRFIARFAQMEAFILEDGLDFDRICLKNMDIYWEKAKKSPQLERSN